MKVTVQKVYKLNKQQLIATTITSSFIERGRHQGLSPLVPIVMLHVPKAIICMYDCTQDILLLSEEFVWMDQDSLS